MLQKKKKKVKKKKSKIDLPTLFFSSLEPEAQLFFFLALLIATKMVSAFADATFTFETDPAFSFEMILRWTINVRPMEGEDTKQSQCE